MQTVTLRKKLSLAPMYLGENSEANILQKLKDKYEGVCTRHDGYIEKSKENCKSS